MWTASCGQIGLGVVKLLLGWLTLGIWPMVDFIVAVVKAYAGPFAKVEDITFENGLYAK